MHCVTVLVETSVQLYVFSSLTYVAERVLCELVVQRKIMGTLRKRKVLPYRDDDVTNHYVGQTRLRYVCTNENLSHQQLDKGLNTYVQLNCEIMRQLDFYGFFQFLTGYGLLHIFETLLVL